MSPSNRGRITWSRVAAGALGAVVVMLVQAPPAEAAPQIPETFDNLQILPGDIQRGALVGVMRNLAGSLGVRCDHCHVGGDPATLEGFDFAADDKESKVVARAMMRMVEEINGTLLPATGRDQLTEVTCYTCHHGAQQPTTLRAELTAEIESGGVEAAIARYQKLREEYYGRAVYDFGRTALSSLAEGLARGSRDFDGATRLLEFNIELYPDWDYHYFMLGQVRFAAEDRDGAVANLKKAIELAPDNDWYRDTLARIEQQQQ